MCLEGILKALRESIRGSRGGGGGGPSGGATVCLWGLSGQKYHSNTTTAYFFNKKPFDKNFGGYPRPS